MLTSIDHSQTDRSNDLLLRPVDLAIGGIALECKSVRWVDVERLDFLEVIALRQGGQLRLICAGMVEILQVRSIGMVLWIMLLIVDDRLLRR